MSHRRTPLAISNEQFDGILKQRSQSSGAYIVLDAREESEVAIGMMPGSTHIRRADLFA